DSSAGSSIATDVPAVSPCLGTGRPTPRIRSTFDTWISSTERSACELRVAKPWARMPIDDSVDRPRASPRGRILVRAGILPDGNLSYHEDLLSTYRIPTDPWSLGTPRIECRSSECPKLTTPPARKQRSSCGQCPTLGTVTGPGLS